MFIESMISPMILEGGNNPDSYIVHIQDITKQIKANKILEESEKTFRRLFENAPTNYQSLDENGCFIEVNQKWLDTLGYTHEEVIGRPFSEFLHPNCLPKFKETFAAFLLNGQVSGIEYQLRCRDGEFIDVSYEGCSKKDETDGSIRTQCVFIDITEQKRTESLIRKERDLAQLYLDIAGSIIVALDADANITLMNKQACNTLACSADEFIGKNWFESFIPESIRSEVQTVFGRIMEGDNIDFSTNENVVQTSTGEEKIISWSNTVLLDDTGTPIGTLSSGQDITEREAILKALKASEELHRLVLSSMNNLIFVIDKNNRYTELYASVVMMANKPPDYFLNKRIEETLPKEIAQKLIESIENVRESGIQDEVEYSLIQDGKEEWFIATINRHQDGESVVQSVRNISLRLKAQRETKQAADTALLYLDIMSHDVRNQLQAIVMATEILEHLELDVESDLMLQLIIDSVEKSQNLINKILSTRNLLSSSLEEQSLLLPLKNAISKIEKSYPNLEIKTDFPNRNICVHADVFIEQLFSNIIENGVEFNKSKNRKLWINIQELENGYQVSITDNGQGISGDKKESLFDPTRRFGGIGIHQSIRILQKYGGHISVYDRVPSDYSQGTEFRLWFPKAA
jgi:PAS domain S-box-containing protein